MEAQTFIYMPCIEADRENFAYSSEEKVKVRWVKVGENKSEENNEMNINLIITKESHIILEIKKEEEDKDDYIATIKISDVKLSKKDNKITLTDRGKGVIGFLLSSNSVLGELIFEPLNEEKVSISESIDEFIERVKEVVKEKKNNKG